MGTLQMERRRSTDVPAFVGERWDDFPTTLDSWFEAPFGGLFQSRLWHPDFDMYDRPKEVVVQIEIPGMDLDGIDISVERDHLVVEGTRTRSDAFKDDNLQYSGRSFGKFHRIVHLSTRVDSGKAVADYENGILTITLPKIKEVIAKKIPLKSK